MSSPDNDPFEITDPETGEIWRLNPDRLVQDIRDFLLRSLRENDKRKPWGKMSEAEQREAVERTEDLAFQLVEGTVHMIAQGKNDVVHAIIKKFAIKDGAVEISAGGIADDGVLLALNHAGKKAVKIVITNVEQFDKHREPAQVMRDEPIMFEDEGEGEDGEAGEDDDDTPTGPDEDAEQEEGRQLLSPQYQGGHASRMGGYPAERNPFNPKDDPQEHADWLAGWKAADERDDAPELNNSGDNSGETGEETAPAEPEAADPGESEPEPEGDAAPEEPAFEDDDPPHDPETGEVLEDGEPDAIDELTRGISSGDDRGEAPEDEEQPDDAKYKIAYDRGKKAFPNGFTLEQNPYPSGDIMHDAWEDGFKTAMDDAGQGEGDASFDD